MTSIGELVKKNEPMMTVEEMKAIMPCNPKTIYDAVRQGRLRAFRLGGRPNGPLRVFRCDFVEFLSDSLVSPTFSEDSESVPAKDTKKKTVLGKDSRKVRR